MPSCNFRSAGFGGSPRNPDKSSVLTYASQRRIHIPVDYTHSAEAPLLKGITHTSRSPSAFLLLNQVSHFFKTNPEFDPTCAPREQRRRSCIRFDTY